MINTHVWMRVNGKDKSLASVLAEEDPELSVAQLVEAENQLRILLDHVVEKLHSGGHFRERMGKMKKRDKENHNELENCLQETSRSISAKGSLQAWINSNRPCRYALTHNQNQILSSFVKGVKQNTHNLTPIMGTYEQKVRSRIDAILWLTFEHVSLEHALLLIYSFPSSTLKGLSPETVYGLFRYLVRCRDSLQCGPLQVEAKSLSPYIVDDVSPAEADSTASESNTCASGMVLKGSATASSSQMNIETSLVVSNQKQSTSKGQVEDLNSTTHTQPLGSKRKRSLEERNKDNDFPGGLVCSVAQFRSTRLQGVEPVLDVDSRIQGPSFGSHSQQLSTHPDGLKALSVTSVDFLEISQLEEDAKELLAIVWLAGGCLPSRFFERANRNLTWGSDGATIFPGSGAPEAYEQIIDNLVRESLIVLLPSNGSETLMVIHPRVPTFLAHQSQVHMEKWKYLTVKAIFHAYPKDPQLLPMAYTEMGASLIPILIRAMSYMHELRRPMLEWSILELGIDACLSASNFGDKLWKTIAVAYAENMANLLVSADISARVQLRKAALARLYKTQSTFDLQTIQIPRTTKRSNADFGRLVLLQARLQIEGRVSNQTINETLNQFDTVGPVSALEDSVRLDINFLRAKLHRYEGEFTVANQILSGFMQALRYRTHNMIMIHYYETLCESGCPEKAVQALEYELEELLRKENGQSGSARRLKLALGGSILMKFLKDRSICYSMLQRAENLFKGIKWQSERSLVTRHNYYVTKASLGMIFLLRSDFEQSLTYWDEALNAARDCFPQTGHAEMLVHYAQSEVLYRIGKNREATAKRTIAQEIFSQCGREFFFLGQGTTWLDRLDELATGSGRQAIAAVGSSES